jgi:hypothetical protein
MAVNLARSCPRCRNYFGVIIAEPKAVGSHNPSMVVVLSADTKSTGRYFQVIAESAVDKISPGPKLDALTAEKVFGWKKVHKHNGALLSRRQDKAGRWRRIKVPNYSTNPLHSYSVENWMQQLGRMDRYQKNSPRSPVPKTFRPIGLRRINAVGRRSKLVEDTARSFR